EIAADQVVVILGLHAVHAQYPHALRERPIARRTQARIAERPEILGGKERETADVPDAARHASLPVPRADRLRGILDDGQTQAIRDVHESVHLADLPV